MEPVTVILETTDPVLTAGAVACLSAYPTIRLCPTAQRARAEVLLIITGEVTNATIDLMRRHRTDDGAPSVVLVTTQIQTDQLLVAARLGLMALLPRSRTDFDAIAAAVVTARAGHGQLPDAALGILLRQMSAQRETGERAEAVELSPREVRVLELLADGIDTVGIAHELNYSERTVKNIVHGVVRRLNLRNRTHAVAYALRTGAIGTPSAGRSPHAAATLHAVAASRAMRRPASYGRAA